MKLVFLVPIVATLLSGCLEPALNNLVDRTPGLRIPTFEQNETVKLIEPYEFKIQKCYWTNEVERPGLENMPQKVREEQRKNFIVKPQDKFLYVEIVASNPGSTPIGWNAVYPAILSVKHSSGTEYEEVETMVNDSMFAATTRGLKLNPARSLTTREYFDIPPSGGTYTLIFYRTENYPGQGRGKGRPVFAWHLSPQ